MFKKIATLTLLTISSISYSKPLNSLWKNNHGGYIDLKKYDFTTAQVNLTVIDPKHGHCKIKMTFLRFIFNLVVH